MKLKVERQHLCVVAYLVLFIFYIYTKQSVIMYATCLVTLFVLFSGAVSIEIALIFSLMVGRELACYLNIFICILYVLIKKKPSKISFNKNIMFFVSVLLFSSLINMIISGALFNTLFGILYYFLVFIVYFLAKGNLDEDKIAYALKLGMLLQFVCGILIILIEKNIKPGDIHCGTFSDANYSVIFLLVSICYLVKYYRSKGLKFLQIFRKEYVYIIGAMFFIYLGSAKNVLAGFFVAVFVYAIAKIVSKKKSRQIICSIIVLYIALLGGIMIMHSRIINNFLMRVAPQELGIYFYDKEYSFKYDYFEGTIFNELAGPRLFFGYGIGQYGSRVANLFGYNSMYREDNAINKFIANNFKETILPNYKKYASKYSKEIASGIQWRSAVLTYPFSSVIAFIAENGVIGLLFVTYIWGKSGNKSKYGFLVTLLFSICIFDVYFDHICVTALMICLLMSDKRKMKQ